MIDKALRFQYNIGKFAGETAVFCLGFTTRLVQCGTPGRNSPGDWRSVAVAVINPVPGALSAGEGVFVLVKCRGM
ncbi:MAG: hypothetical protein ACYCX4_00910 [Bacillota bacterium]